MSEYSGRLHARLLGGAAALALSAGMAHAEPANFNIAPQPLSLAVGAFSEQSGRPVLLKPELAGKLSTRGVNGSLEPEMALAAMLEGTGLSYRRNGDAFLIVEAQNPQSGSAAGDGAEVEALIVTAQKREEDIQDVPIAISAFSQRDLEAQKIEGGFDLLKAIPNVTFSKNNFTSYNFSIRGIGTKAISATTDPGVAVAFNYSSLIQNRLFEQEYFDVERVEVLRGPQGTLYGRNATGGVINVISAKPEMDTFSGSIKAEVGNYNSKRLVAVSNVPVIDDVLAIRVAGAITQRDGYGFNERTGNDVDGRDLWSMRLSVSFAPMERLRADLVWERFHENDNRARTSKQLCHRDLGPESIGSQTVYEFVGDRAVGQRALFSTGCKAGSLYDPAALATPYGTAMPFVFAVPRLRDLGYALGYLPDPDLGWPPGTPLEWNDPYGGMMQSPDLRRISSLRDPVYRASADVLALNISFDVTDDLTLYSQTVYNEDEVYSTQDYNRFNTVPVFEDSSTWLNLFLDGPSEYAAITKGGYFCDPQLGCSNTIVGQDISQARGVQFGQELRLQSAFDGPVNFSLGANYTRFRAEADYYVMNNLLTMLSMMQPLSSGLGDYTKCMRDTIGGDGTLVDIDDPSIPDASKCVYVDPNPLESINGEGHNYFRSKNPYRLQSGALFGEIYWNVADAVKVTAGLRYTDDRKVFTPVPTQALLSSGLLSGGTVYRGYPELPEIDQRWQEVTGRLGVDWRPDLAFTNETMLYAFYSRGYKGGGANPPSIGLETRTIAERVGLPPGTAPQYDVPALWLTAQNYPEVFRPEFVNAFEVGAKNVLLDGALVANVTAFYYDYTDYQVSKIVDRTAVNENFDAKAWGLELETIFRPTRDLTINANLGLLDTKVGKDAKSIDIMNRTQGNPGWVVAKPWMQLPSNCVVPVSVVEAYLAWINASTYRLGSTGSSQLLCGGEYSAAIMAGALGIDYDPATDAPNGGAGFFDELAGNDLPNSPHWTFNIGAQYAFEVLPGWEMTVRGDYYRQGDSYHRIYNTEYDKLKGWENANIRLTLERPADDLVIEAYVKNVFDDDPITDAFTNSDDTGLTTNVFVLDPRLIGLSIRKGF